MSPHESGRPRKNLADAIVWFVIPAYNEASTLPKIIARIRNQYRNVVVIDDGSEDDSASAAQKAGAVVLRHAVNLGQGAALKTGIEFALRNRAEFIVTFDADDQHHVDDIPLMMEKLLATHADVALGSRFLGQAVNMPKSREILLKLGILYTRLTTGLRVTDTHNGLRLLTADAARKIQLTQNGMSHASEILDQIAFHRLKWIEVPVRISYTAYSLRKGQRTIALFRILREIMARSVLR